MRKVTQKLPILVSLILFISIFFVGAAEQSVTDNQISIISDQTEYHCEPIFNEKGQCLIRAQITVQYLSPDASAISVKSEFSTDVKEPEYKFIASSNIEAAAVIAKDQLKAEQVMTDTAAQVQLAAEQPIKEQPIEQLPTGGLKGGGLGGIEPIGADIMPAEAIMLSEPLEIAKADDFTTEPMDVQPTDTQIIQLEFWADKDGKFNVVVDNNGVTTTLDPIYNITVNSATPSWYLQTGYSLAPSMFNYSLITNITAGLSDVSSLTSYATSVRQPYYYSDMAFYYIMNFAAPISISDNSPYANPLYFRPNTQFITSFTTSLYLALNTTNAANSGASAVYQSQLDIGLQNFTYCAMFNTTTNSNTRYVLSTHDASNVGYGIYMDNSGRAHCTAKDDNSVEIDLNSVTGYNVGALTAVCCRRNVSNGKFELLVNGTVKASDTGGIDTSITTYGDLIVGGRGAVGTNGWAGAVDEVVLWKRFMTDAELVNYSLYGAAIPQTATMIQPSFNYNITDPSKVWLHIDGDFNYPLRVYSMLNSTEANLNNYTQQQLLQADTYIPLTSLITAGYNNPFRIVNLNAENNSINNVYLVISVNDSTAPTIYNCGVNDSIVDCDDGVEWFCHISDNGQVVSAFGRVQFGNYFNLTLPASQDLSDPTKWSVKLSAFQITSLLSSMGWNFSTSVNNSLVYVNASDLGGNTQQNTNNGVSNTYSCILGCVENWVASNSSCGYNDTFQKTYLDSNGCGTTHLLPLDNGTSYGCNFCSPIITNISNNVCFYNNDTFVKNFTYTDLNYYSCCAITNLYTDCPTLYSPFNQTVQSGCINQQVDFVVNHPATCEFDLKANDKCYFQFDLNRTGNWKCLGLVRTPSNDLIQTTPDYTAKANTLITFGSSDFEDRQYFEAQNGIGTAYFTQENLIIDGRAYMFTIQCSDGNTTLTSDHLLKVEYSNLNSPVTRSVWAVSQMGVIIFSLVIVVIILFVFAVIWGINKRNIR